MTASDLLSRCRAAGIDLAAGPGGALVWEALDDPPATLLAAVANSKAALLALLHQAPRWNQAEAEHQLTELRAEVDALKAGFGVRLPAPLGALLADALVIGERYIREHDREAARGWDALELLRELVPHVRELAARWRCPLSVCDRDGEG